jgi:hypothetical protein
MGKDSITSLVWFQYKYYIICVTSDLSVGHSMNSNFYGELMF